MGIFSKIKNAIFGRDKNDNKAIADNGEPIGEARTASDDNAVSLIDVWAKLERMPGADNLNWRDSIVDLMKLIGLDASFAERKELAAELGRPEYTGSADDNVWLHWAVMKGLADNGGKVPEEFRD